MPFVWVQDISIGGSIDSVDIQEIRDNLDSVEDTKCIADDAGALVGEDVGENVGEDTGENVGADVGANPGENVGANPGEDVGENVGANNPEDTGDFITANPGEDIGENVGANTGALSGENNAEMSDQTQDWVGHDPSYLDTHLEHDKSSGHDSGHLP